MPGVPALHNGRTVVRHAATWKYNGKEMCLLGPDGKPGATFPINTNAASTDDNSLGKAHRKAYKRIFEMCTRTAFTEDMDGEDLEQMPAQPATANEKISQVTKPSPTTPAESIPATSRTATEIIQADIGPMLNEFLGGDNASIAKTVKDVFGCQYAQLERQPAAALESKIATLKAYLEALPEA
jgi:hypothetical protein